MEQYKAEVAAATLKHEEAKSSFDSQVSTNTHNTCGEQEYHSLYILKCGHMNWYVYCCFCLAGRGAVCYAREVSL